MKKFRKLLPALSMLLISALLMGSSTFAWFSMNTNVTVSGMQMSAAASPSLVISTTRTTAETNSILATMTAAEHTSLFDATAIDSTNDAWTGTKENGVVSSSGLKTVTNREDIDPATGSAFTGKTLNYKAAVNDSNNYYYVDYTVYVASKAASLANQKLTVSISSMQLRLKFLPINQANLKQ